MTTSRIAPAVTLAWLLVAGCGGATREARTPPAEPPPAERERLMIHMLEEPLELAEPPAPPDPAIDDIREAIFRHLFANNGSVRQQSAGAYCLSVEKDRDPTPELMARFARNRPPVVAASRCKLGFGMHDSVTGASAVVFFVTFVRRDGPDKASARGGYSEDILSGAVEDYELTRQRGVWTVTAVHEGWVT